MTEPFVLPQRLTRSLRRECGTCNAFMPNKAVNPKAGAARQGWCVANPPQLMVGHAQASALNPGQLVPVHQGAWPPTESNKYCRAWQPMDEIDDGAN